MNAKLNKKRPWPEIFHAGIAPRLGREGLQALAEALERDSSELIQGETVHPDLNTTWREEECTGACALAYPLWKTLELFSIGNTEREFTQLCIKVDNQMGAGAAMRFVLWFDETPRPEMRRELLREVRRAIEHESQPADPRGRPAKGGAA
jgi:hypothetical protein